MSELWATRDAEGSLRYFVYIWRNKPNNHDGVYVNDKSPVFSVRVQTFEETFGWTLDKGGIEPIEIVRKGKEVPRKLTEDDFPYKINDKCREAFERAAKIKAVYKELMTALTESLVDSHKDPWEIIIEEYPELCEFLKDKGDVYFSYRQGMESVVVKKVKEQQDAEG